MLIDTHIWIWWLVGRDSSKLSAKEISLLDQHAESGTLYISAISMLEVQMLVRKKRVKFTIPFEQWLREATRTDVVQVLPIDITVILAVDKLPATFHGDPADRIIYATKKAHGLKLMSHEKQLRKSNV